MLGYSVKMEPLRRRMSKRLRLYYKNDKSTSFVFRLFSGPFSFLLRCQRAFHVSGFYWKTKISSQVQNSEGQELTGKQAHGRYALYVAIKHG